VQVIVLNGASSAGKTSLAAAIQRLMPEPWLSVGIDTMITGMPPQLHASRDGLLFYPDGRIVVGPQFTALEAAWRIGLGAMARSGLRLVLDEVIFNGEEGQRQWNAALAGLDVLWVGVKCDLAVLEAREMARGDRVAGMAAKQAALVHEGFAYDLEVDTSRMSAAECAEIVVGRAR
jgi:chloramphenicol 3-O phosphotransferase